MRKIPVQEFVRRLKQRFDEHPDCKIFFFLGAGCSMSSGIPGAGNLVSQWLPRLKKLQTGNDDDYEAWLKKTYPDLTQENAAQFYGPVITELFHHKEDRQREIEHRTECKDPGFGYSVLAQLIAHPEYGRNCNAVLTTNFDDLVADALYLYTNKKPLVITHESLASFVRVTSSKPLVLKVHGDAHLEPRNTDDETGELQDSVKTALKRLLSESGIVFVGYGGNDKGIAEIMEELPPEALPGGGYWVGETIPETRLGEWLTGNDAFWVEHKDFDELMLLFWKEFNLEHPKKERFDSLMKTYHETFEKLQKKIEKSPKTDTKNILSEALQKAIEKADTWWGVELEARKYKKSDPEKADDIYKAGMEKFSDSAPLCGNYALFLTESHKDYDKAEEYYKKALEVDPNDATGLGNYALFLAKKRQDHDKAEEYYKKALEIDPNHANNLSNYGQFLTSIRKDHDKAEVYYKEALEIDPNHTNNLGNYAQLLTGIRKDHDKAEVYYKKALEVDPNRVGNVSNYSIFLKNVRKDYDKAEVYFKKALEVDPNQATILGNYANFLGFACKDQEKAEEYYKKALEADPNDANILGSYALFLQDIRKDHGKVEEYFKKALELDPNDANCRANYAKFFLARGDSEGFRLLNESLLLQKKDNYTLQELYLECQFYFFAHTKETDKQRDALIEIKELLEAGVRSLGWSLEDNVARAVQDGHPDPKLLRQLARVISGELGLKVLRVLKLWLKPELYGQKQKRKP